MSDLLHRGYSQDEKSDLHTLSYPVLRCKFRECNTFAIVIDNLQHIYSLFENNFCDVMIES